VARISSYLRGSPYYVAAGIALLCSGVFLLINRFRPGLLVYGLLFIATALWSVVEVGLSLWGLLPRLGILAVLAMILLVLETLSAPRREGKRVSRNLTTRCLSIIPIVVTLLLILGTAFRDLKTDMAPYSIVSSSSYKPSGTVDEGVLAGEWSNYGRTEGGERFSPLEQITPANVKGLKVAWTYHTDGLPAKGENGEKGDERQFNFEATPLKIGDRLGRVHTTF